VNPEQLRYTSTHEWVHVQAGEGDQQIATVGLTSFATEALTDLVFIQLPEVGQQVQAGQPFGEVESVKAVSDIYSPLDGEVVEVNTAVAENLDLLSGDPFGAGWLIKVRISDPGQLQGLLDYAAYQRECEQQADEH